MGCCSLKESELKIIDVERRVHSYITTVFDGSIFKHKENPPQTKTSETGQISDQLLHPNTVRVVASYDDIKQKLVDDPSKLFEDKDFPPVRESLSKDPNYLNQVKIKWKRPKQFLSGNINVFEGQIEPNDIKQGALGDCYFLSSLSVLSEIPILVKKLFITNKYQENGLYGIYLCHDGEFVQVPLDDYFPCVENNGPVFSKTNGNEMWVLLLEKAYAKIYGTYDKIEAGLAGHALRDLTGAPFQYFVRGGETNLDADKCWDFIIKFVEKKYLLTASSEVNPKGIESENSTGIISSHCYAILDAKNVKDNIGNPDRILQLRNPWGRKEWTGDWSDNSNKWTQQLREQLNVQKADDGTFWIGVKNFIQEFSQVSVCKVNPQYLYNSIRIYGITIPEPETRRMILMRVFEDTHAFISLHQKDKRTYAKEPNKKYLYSLGRLIVGKIDQDLNKVYQYNGCAIDDDREIVVEGQFEKGDYAIYIEMDWQQDFVRDMVVSSYSEKPVIFEEPKINPQLFETILDQFLQVAVSTDKTIKKNEYKKDLVKFSGYRGGYVFFLYINQSNSTLQEQVTMKNIQHLKICSPYTDSNKFTVEVSPNSTILIKFRVQKTGGGNYGYSTSSSSLVIEKFTQNQLIQQTLENPQQVNQRKIQEQVKQFYQFNLQNINVFINVFSYTGGVALYYQNKTDLVYKETLFLKLTNLKCDLIDEEGKILIILEKDTKKLIELKAIDLNQPFSYQMQMQYQLM